MFGIYVIDLCNNWKISLVLLINIYWKQQTTKHNECSLIGWKLWHNARILHKHNPFERIRDPDNCDVRVIFLWRFFTWPRNHYNDNKSSALTYTVCCERKEELVFILLLYCASLIWFCGKLYLFFFSCLVHSSSTRFTSQNSLLFNPFLLAVWGGSLSMKK